MQLVKFKDLGIIDYKTAWDYQELLLQENVLIKSNARKTNPDYDVKMLPTQQHFLLCEHNPVYTLGKSGSMNNMLMSEEEMNAQNIQFFKTNRGGDITFHGPQQLVDVRDGGQALIGVAGLAHGYLGQAERGSGHAHG